jgi:transcriptional regulator with XRE-family HTH domain
VSPGANTGNYAQGASEFLRALRQARSQRAFARRLGYRANPITDWEHGRRFPTAEEAFRAAQLSRIDVPAAFAAFHPAPLREARRGIYDLAQWLDAARGSSSLSEVATRAGVSRFALGRWLRGDAKPRLPDFFATVDAITGRLPDLVAELVPIADVPALRARHEAAQAARRAAHDAPWSEAILRVLECASYRALAQHEDAWVAGRLAITTSEVHKSLKVLRQAKAVRKARGLYRVSDDGTVDTRGDADRVTRLLEHWSATAGTRVARRTAEELYAYNVFSVSSEDLVRVRELLRGSFREVRSLVAASEQVERVALLNIQLVLLDAPALTR